MIKYPKNYKDLSNYCFRIRINVIRNSINTNKLVESWISKNYKLDKKIDTLRNIHTFLSFRYFMRFLVIEEYYDSLYKLIEYLIKDKDTSKNKFLSIRQFIIQWLQEGKNHIELIHEITNYICSMPEKIDSR